MYRRATAYSKTVKPGEWCIYNVSSWGTASLFSHLKRCSFEFSSWHKQCVSSTWGHWTRQSSLKVSTRSILGMSGKGAKCEEVITISLVFRLLICIWLTIGYPKSRDVSVRLINWRTSFFSFPLFSSLPPIPYFSFPSRPFLSLPWPFPYLFRSIRSRLSLIKPPLTSTWPHLRCDVGLEEGEYR